MNGHRVNLRKYFKIWSSWKSWSGCIPFYGIHSVHYWLCVSGGQVVAVCTFVDCSVQVKSLLDLKEAYEVGFYGPLRNFKFYDISHVI